jgi:hypothetical protein
MLKIQIFTAIKLIIHDGKSKVDIFANNQAKYLLKSACGNCTSMTLAKIRNSDNESLIFLLFLYYIY